MSFFGWPVISTDKNEHLVARINRFGLLANKPSVYGLKLA